MLMLPFLSVNAQVEYNDGPYVEYTGDSTEILWIKNGALKEKTVLRDSDFILDVEGLPKVDIGGLNVCMDAGSEFKDVEKFVALSDIHGQFDVFESLLIANKIVDESGEWLYGKGHLVVVGDIFDRGPEVLKVCWFLYHLEQKAKEKGGMVHVLLGNHELMVLDGDLGYLNNKYRYTSGVTGRSYDDLFNINSFLGRWLRSKNIMLSINDVVFVHGGFSPALVDLDKSVTALNSIFRNQILLAADKENIKADPVTNLLYFHSGPLWYRGNAQPYSFDTDRAKQLLRALRKKTVVIGHTSMPKVMGLYSNRIILVDSSIKFGKSGELLMYDNGTFSKGRMDGENVPLIPENETKNPPDLASKLIGQKKGSLFLHVPVLGAAEEYKDLEGVVLAGVYFDSYVLDFGATLKVKGRPNKDDCEFLRFEIILSSSQVKNFGFSGENVLTVELPCQQEGHQNAELVKDRVKELNSIDTKNLHKIIALVLAGDAGMTERMYAILFSEK